MSFPLEGGVVEAYVLQTGEGRSIDLGAFAMTVKAGDAQNGGAFTLLEADEPPGFGPPLHIHHDAAEAFYVVEGEYIIFLPSGEVRCPAGAFIFIPAGIEHGFRVGRTQSRKLNLYTPAAMVGYFEEMAAAAGDLDETSLTKLAAKYSVEVTGAVPEGYL
jgi:mannose-6-phosphate isomerase-like protein (cupin superfamily)